MQQTRPLQDRMNPAFYSLTFAAIVLAGEMFMNFLFPARPWQMAFSWPPVFLWCIAGGVFSLVRSRLNAVIVIALLGYYWVGNLNAVASYFYYGQHYLTELQAANLIYSSYALVFVIGIVIFEKLTRAPVSIDILALRKEPNNTIFFICTMLYPLIWIADELWTLKRIPILSGESIVNEIYNIEYGRLYGYGVLLGVSALLIWSKLRQKVESGRILLFVGLFVASFAMVFDGRRVFLMVFLGALFAYEITGFPAQKLWKPVVKLFLLLLFFYVAILFFRQGGRLISYPNPADIFSKVGVEYRDFAYVVTHVKPGELRGYSWLGSAVGGFGNWFILAILGLNKNELVFSGSAYQLALVYRSAFGIRIGLIPEIWMQYSMLGAVFCLPVAALYAGIARLVERAKSEVGRILAAMAFGVALLSFVGQSSAITGYWSLILYLSLIWLFLELFRRPQVSIAKDSGIISNG